MKIKPIQNITIILSVLLFSLLFLLPVNIYGQSADSVGEPRAPKTDPSTIPAIPSPDHDFSGRKGEGDTQQERTEPSSPNQNEGLNDQEANDSGNLQTRDITVQDVNTGEAVPRTGGAQVFGSLLVILTITLGSYFYHTKIRDKSQFKITEKKLR